MIKLPKEVNICGLKHIVKFPYLFKDDDTLLGLYENAQATIKITDTSSGFKRPLQLIHETLIHEMFHGIDHIFCDGELDHEILSKLAIGWYQVLADNNIFSIKGIPKNIKICGFNFDVQFPYVFEDETDTWGSTNNNFLWIRLPDRDESGMFSPDFVKQKLIHLITCAVTGIFCTDLFDCISAFSSGIYQVFKDNNIENLVKSGIK